MLCHHPVLSSAGIAPIVYPIHHNSHALLSLSLLWSRQATPPPPNIEHCLNANTPSSFHLHHTALPHRTAEPPPPRPRRRFLKPRRPRFAWSFVLANCRAALADCACVCVCVCTKLCIGVLAPCVYVCLCARFGVCGGAAFSNDRLTGSLSTCQNND